MKIDRADIAVRFTEERAKSGYTQRDFANQLGVSTETLRRYESGQSRIDAELLARAAGFGVDVQYVLVGVRTKNQNSVENAASPMRDVPPGTLTPNVAISGSTNVIGNAQAGAVINQIHNTNPINKTIANTQPGITHITDEQAARLQLLVQTVVEEEKRYKKSPKSFRAVWAALNAHCKSPSYRLILLQNYPKAEKYLLNWIGRLNSAASAHKKDNSAWRKRKYAYIKINTQDELSCRRLKDMLKTKYGVDSLTLLSDEDLDRVYRYVASKKSATNRTA